MKLDIGGTLHTLMCVRGNPANDYDRELASQWEDYINVDKFHVNERTIAASIFEIPVPDNSADHIYSSHTIEHVHQVDVPQLLKEWYRILKPGSSIWMSSPSITRMLNDFLDNYDKSDETYNFYHDIIFANHLDEGDHHLAAFTPEVLSSLMKDVGFVIDDIKCFYPCHGQEEVRVVAHK